MSLKPDTRKLQVVGRAQQTSKQPPQPQSSKQHQRARQAVRGVEKEENDTAESVEGEEERKKE